MSSLAPAAPPRPAVMRREDTWKPMTKDPSLINQQCQSYSQLIDRFAKSQIKSMTTLPSYNFVTYSPRKLEQMRHNLKRDYDASQKITSTTSLGEHKPSKLKKTSHREFLKQGYGFKVADMQKHSIHHQTSGQMPYAKLQQENMALRSKLLDCQLRERQHVERINKLETAYARLEQLVGQKKPPGQDAQFVKVMKKAFKDCFGLTGLKQIWGKEKEILREWMEDRLAKTKQEQNTIGRPIKIAREKFLRRNYDKTFESKQEQQHSIELSSCSDDSSHDQQPSNQIRIKIKPGDSSVPSENVRVLLQNNP